MSNLHLTLHDDVTPEEIAFLDERINEHNVARTGVDDGKYLAVWLRDEAGQAVGGLFGWTWAGWLEIRYLWIREDARGLGYGREMLRLAEAEAIARGCERVVLDSYSFQAPGFYQKLGYDVFGSLPGFPGAHTRYYLWKQLAASAQPDDAAPDDATKNGKELSDE
jgi:ribosomal protein S18 acetylase RimI-like enzyme